MTHPIARLALSQRPAFGRMEQALPLEARPDRSDEDRLLEELLASYVRAD